MVPGPRSSVIERLSRSDIRLVVSGHLHQHRDRSIAGIRHLWAPSTAFAAPHDFGGDGRCGLIALDFTDGRVQVAVERPEGLISHDLAAIKGHGRYKFLRDMPHAPPAVAA